MHAGSPTAPDDLFALLGNETRVAILEALWDRFDIEAYMLADQDPVPFSDLRAAADVDDVGNFNYHLGQLEGSLIEAHDEGYVLSPYGYNVLHALEGHTSFQYWTIEPTRLSDPCPFCDGVLEGSYEREIVSVTCRDCAAHGGGSLNRVRVPVSDGEPADLEEVLELSVLKLVSSFAAITYGRCPSCNHPAEVSLLSDDAGTGDSHQDVNCRVRCEACGSGGFGPAHEQALADPTVQTFFRDQGLGPADGLWAYRLAVLRSLSTHVEETDPVTVRYRFTHEQDACEIRLTEGPNGIRFAPVE